MSAGTDDGGWDVANADEVSSPALLVFPERIRENLRRMRRICPDARRLRPHLKTHKMAEILRLQLEAGITRSKCATPAEAELAGRAGVPDVLLAYPVVGPNVARIVGLVRAFPATTFSVVADDPAAVAALSAAAREAGISLAVLLDVDCGMHRTGLAPGPAAVELYRTIARSPGLRAGGLHAYDGHVHASDPTERRAQWEAAMAPVRRLRTELAAAGLPVPAVVAGGTPTFALHAAAGDVECGPGTTVLWDAGYAEAFPDLDFQPAAAVLTRVISRPAENRLCVDLGYKAISSDKPHPRVQFPALPDARAEMHSEEHLVLATSRAAEFPPGTVLIGIPRHICPTVALYDEAVVVEQGRATGVWPVAARARRLRS